MLPTLVLQTFWKHLYILYNHHQDCAGSEASIYYQLFMAMQDRHRNYIPVYTDCSLGGNSMACASFPIRQRNFHFY